MSVKNEIIEGQKRVEEKTEELIYEFHAHYQEYVGLHPEDKDRRDEIFQAWVIQKIAGIQISILELANSLNSHVKRASEHCSPVKAQNRKVLSSSKTKKK